MSVDIISASRYFGRYIESFNEDEEINLNKVEKFSKLIIRLKGANDPAVSNYIVKRIENQEAKETLSYLLGISEVVPKLIPEELKLKYQLLRMVRPAEHFKRKKLLAAYEGIPETERLDIIEKLFTVLNGKRVNPRNVLEFASLLEGMGKQSLEQRNRVLEDFQKLMNQNIVIFEDGLIEILNKFFSVEPEEWPHVMDRMCLIAEKAKGKLDIYFFHNFFEFFSQPYREEKENWVKLMEKTSDLVIKMDGNLDCYQLINAMTDFEDLSSNTRFKLMNVLSQLRGMGDCVYSLTNTFLGILDQQWPEMVESFNKLAGKNSCDNILLINGIAKGRPGERLHVIDLVDDFISKLNKTEIYAAEKARLLEAAGEVPQDKLKDKLAAALALYEEVKASGKELSGIELAKYIRVISAENKLQMKKAVYDLEDGERRKPLLQIFNTIPLVEWPELAGCFLRLPAHDDALDVLKAIAKTGKGQRLALMTQLYAFIEDLKIHVSMKERIIEALAKTPSDRRPHAMDCTLTLWHRLKGKYDSYYDQFLYAFGALPTPEALELQNLCLEHLTVGLYVGAVDKLIQIAAENPQSKREPIFKDVRKLYEEIKAIGKEPSGFELVNYTKLVSCIPETNYLCLRDHSQVIQEKLEKALSELGEGEKGKLLPKIFNNIPTAKWPEMAACFIKLSVRGEYFAICEIANVPSRNRVDVAKLLDAHIKDYYQQHQKHAYDYADFIKKNALGAS